MDNAYAKLIAELKKNIIQSRYIAAKLANKEQLILYFKTGRMLAEKVEMGKRGSKVLEQIAVGLQKELPGLRGFSARSLWYMKKLYTDYQELTSLQSPIAVLREVRSSGVVSVDQQEKFWSISFTHHIQLMDKCKNMEERFFYIEQAASQFWSVSILKHHINANLYAHQGKLPNNFRTTLPAELGPSALQVFQDEYLMDFITEEETEDEKVFEGKVVADIKNFILRLGKGFSFISNQFRLEVDGEEFFVDLLFFNRYTKSLIAFELKRGKFKPEYAGQLNFYLNVLDEKVRLPHENASIGIVLCKEKNNTVVEFAVKTIDKAMGVATYRTTREMPKEMQDILPDAIELAKLL